MNEWIYWSLKKLFNKRIDENIKGWIEQWIMNEWMIKWINWLMNVWVDERYWRSVYANDEKGSGKIFSKRSEFSKQRYPCLLLSDNTY